MATDALVELRGGLTIPLEALRLALELEARGWTLTLKGEKLALRWGSPEAAEGPREDALTEAEQGAIRRWRTHLLAIVAYHNPDRP